MNLFHDFTTIFYDFITILGHDFPWFSMISWKFWPQTDWLKTISLQKEICWKCWHHKRKVLIKKCSSGMFGFLLQPSMTCVWSGSEKTRNFEKTFLFKILTNFGLVCTMTKVNLQSDFPRELWKMCLDFVPIFEKKLYSFNQAKINFFFITDSH